MSTKPGPGSTSSAMPARVSKPPRTATTAVFTVGWCPTHRVVMRHRPVDGSTRLTSSDAEALWRLCTRLIEPDEARHRVTVVGDQALADAALRSSPSSADRGFLHATTTAGAECAQPMLRWCTGACGCATGLGPPLLVCRLSP